MTIDPRKYLVGVMVLIAGLDRPVILRAWAALVLPALCVAASRLLRLRKTSSVYNDYRIVAAEYGDRRNLVINIIADCLLRPWFVIRRVVVHNYREARAGHGRKTLIAWLITFAGLVTLDIAIDPNWQDLILTISFSVLCATVITTYVSACVRLFPQNYRAIRYGQGGQVTADDGMHAVPKTNRKEQNNGR